MLPELSGFFLITLTIAPAAQPGPSLLCGPSPAPKIGFPKGDEEEMARRKRLRAHAEALIDREREEFLRFREDWTLESKGHVVPLEHPVLAEHLPGFRFYFVEMMLRRQDGRGHPKSRDHAYSLAIMERETEAIRMGPPGWLDVVALLREAKASAKTESEIREVYLLFHLLETLNTRMIMPGTDEVGCFSSKQVMRRVLQNARLRAGIEIQAPFVTPPKRVRVVFGKGRNHAVLLGWGPSDWNLPRSLVYRLLTFDKDGFYVGQEKRDGKTFPADQDLESKPVQASVKTFLEKLAEE